jgi:hypothetical protein
MKLAANGLTSSSYDRTEGRRQEAKKGKRQRAEGKNSALSYPIKADRWLLNADH